MSLPLPPRRAGRLLFGIAAAASLCACATEPVGPSIAVVPKAGESLADFQQHDVACRAYAAGPAAGKTTPEGRAVASAAAGAGVGAAAGALIGSADGRAGNGAAIGAGSGLLVGSLVGLGRERRAEAAAQRRYDIAYAQCMTTYGEHAPLPARRAAVAAPPPPVVYVAPPVVYAAPPVAYAPPPPPAP